MDVLLKKAIVTQNQTIHKGENPFQAVKITEVLEDGSTQEFTMSGQPEDFTKIEVLEKCQLKLQMGGYINGFNQKLVVKAIEQKLLNDKG